MNNQRNSRGKNNNNNITGYHDVGASGIIVWSVWRCFICFTLVISFMCTRIGQVSGRRLFGGHESNIYFAISIDSLNVHVIVVRIAYNQHIPLISSQYLFLFCIYIQYLNINSRSGSIPFFFFFYSPYFFHFFLRVHLSFHFSMSNRK